MHRKLVLLFGLTLAAALAGAPGAALALDDGTIAGTVTDGQAGTLLEGVEVIFSPEDKDQGDGEVFHRPIFQARTDASGRYSQELPQGGYTVTFLKHGYEDGLVYGVAAVSGATTTLDAKLKPAPSRL
jgi:hypothetical protein